MAMLQKQVLTKRLINFCLGVGASSKYLSQLGKVLFLNPNGITVAAAFTHPLDLTKVYVPYHFVE